MNAVEPNVTHDTEEEHPGTPFWLKTLVVVLGLAIIAMLALIIFKVVAGDHQKKEDADLPLLTMKGNQYQPGTRYSDHEITIPDGASLVEVRPNGGELMLHVKLRDGHEEILFLDRASGVVTTVRIQNGNRSE